MSHAHHNARRIQRSVVPHARLRLHSPYRKDLLLGVLVGGSMLLVGGLYAASMRYQKVYAQTTEAFPRWMSLTDGVIEQAQPVQTQIERLKSALASVADAKKTQVIAAGLLKRKIETRAAASSTPETPETP